MFLIPMYDYLCLLRDKNSHLLGFSVGKFLSYWYLHAERCRKVKFLSTSFIPYLILTWLALGYTCNTHVRFLDVFPLNGLNKYFNSCSVNIFSRFPIFSCYVYDFRGKGSNSQRYVDDVKLDDLATVIWIGRGSRIVLQGGIIVPANFTSCTSMIHAFGRYDEHFCSDARPDLLDDEFWSLNMTNVQYRWLRNGHILVGEDGI